MQMTNEKLIQDDKTLQICAVCNGDITGKTNKKDGKLLLFNLLCRSQPRANGKS